MSAYAAKPIQNEPPDPLLLFAQRAALADMDPGPEVAKLRLKRVFPILIYFEQDNKELENSVLTEYRSVFEDDFFLGPQDVITGSKFIFLFPKHRQPIDDRSFKEKLAEFVPRFLKRGLVATGIAVTIGTGVVLVFPSNPVQNSGEKTKLEQTYKNNVDKTGSSTEFWYDTFTAENKEKVETTTKAAEFLHGGFEIWFWAWKRRESKGEGDDQESGKNDAHL